MQRRGDVCESRSGSHRNQEIGNETLRIEHDSSSTSRGLDYELQRLTLLKARVGEGDIRNEYIRASKLRRTCVSTQGLSRTEYEGQTVESSG